MTTAQQLTGATHPISFLDKDAKEIQLLMSPLSDIDIAELDSWVQSVCIENARNSLPANAPQRDIDLTMNSAMVTSMGLSAFSGAGARLMGTPRGVARMVWQSCKANHKTLTVAQVMQYMFNPQNVNCANLIFRKLNMPETFDPKVRETKPGNVRAGKRQRKP